MVRGCAEVDSRDGAAEGGMSMGVYIKGMEMPTRCAECRLSTVHSFNERPLCDALVEYMSYGEWETKRLDNCPLVPVPKHGRLIDADAEVARVQNLYNKAIAKDPEMGCVSVYEGEIAVLKLAPTIIPAEEGE